MYLISLLFVADAAQTPDRHGFQSVAALARVHLSSQNVQHATGRFFLNGTAVYVCVRMCVTKRLRSKNPAIPADVP